MVAYIEFKVKATKEDLEVFEDGIVPWISLEKPDKEISRLIDADKVVLPYSSVVLYIEVYKDTDRKITLVLSVES